MKHIGKIVAIIVLGILLVVLITGCEYRKIPTSKYDPIISGDGSTWFEIISPDGVHYWSFSPNPSVNYNITPRYDNDGRLVIDKEFPSEDDIYG